jgi:hypothetical protein
VNAGFAWENGFCHAKTHIMKRTIVIIAGVCCLALLTPNLAEAAGKKKKQQTDNGGAAKQVMAKYDNNTNGILDASEIEALKKDFAAGNASMAAVFDTDKNGKLDDSEIAALQAATPAPAKEGKKKRRNG